MRYYAGSRRPLAALAFMGILATSPAWAADESQEPPLLFSVSVGAVSVAAAEGQSVQMAGTFQDPSVTVRPVPHRVFPYGGVSFRYPRAFTFEADLKDLVRSWTLSGNDFKVMLFAFPMVVTPETQVEGLIKHYGRANCRVLDERAELRLGATTLKGIRLEVTLAGSRLLQAAYRVPFTGKGSRLLILQDSPGRGDRSEEGVRALELIAASFKTAG